MNWLSTIGIAFALAMDAFAVSVAAGLVIERLTGRHVFRLAFHFGLFQLIMPILGWLIGQSVVDRVGAYSCWVAFAILVGVGAKMLWDAWSGDDRPRGDPTRGRSLVLLSLATSMDALAVGVSMALLGVSIWLPCVVIGAVAAAMTAAGIFLGRRLGSKGRRWPEILGGIVLIGIGIKILLSHVSAP